MFYILLVTINHIICFVCYPLTLIVVVLLSDELLPNDLLFVKIILDLIQEIGSKFANEDSSEDESNATYIEPNVKHSIQCSLTFKAFERQQKEKENVGFLSSAFPILSALKY